MSEHPIPADIEVLHGQHVEVEEVDLIEDSDGIPSWIKVEREMATVVIVPSLLRAPAHHAPRVPAEREHVDPLPQPEEAAP